MNDLFLKLTSNFKIDLNLEEMFKKFSKEYIVKPTDGPGFMHCIEGSSEVYWQTYLNGTAFSRGFYLAFPEETKQIVSQIQELQQNTLENGSALVKRFKEDIVDPQHIYLIRIKAGTNAEPHIDGNRSLALNIGIRNSNSRETIISEDTDIKNFWRSTMHSFRMEDGDAYLINTSYPHAVKTTVNTERINARYLLTYSIK
jgi:hypothetical protein